MDVLTIIIMTRNTIGIDQRTLWVGLQRALTCDIGSQVQTVASSASFGEDIMGQSQTVITKVPTQGEGSLSRLVIRRCVQREGRSCCHIRRAPSTIGNGDPM